jgi:DNA-binding NarL/FixJ family response regulator
MIRVLVADDQHLVRQGIRALLELVPGVAVVGEAADGEEALELVRRLEPDLVLLDVRMPRLDGVAVLERLASERRRVPALVLTTFDDDEAMFACVRAGARGYLLKDVTLEQLAEAVRVVAGGGEILRPAITARVAKGLGEGRCAFPALDPPDPLTGREQDVLRLLSAGCSNREIAVALRLAEGTVKNHISSILSKLGVRDRTRAVLRAFELRYLG